MPKLFPFYINVNDTQGDECLIYIGNNSISPKAVWSPFICQNSSTCLWAKREGNSFYLLIGWLCEAFLNWALLLEKVTNVGGVLLQFPSIHRIPRIWHSNYSSWSSNQRASCLISCLFFSVFAFDHQNSWTHEIALKMQAFSQEFSNTSTIYHFTSICLHWRQWQHFYEILVSFSHIILQLNLII